MGTRDGAIATATRFFYSGGFRDRLAELVAIPSTPQDPGHEADVRRYLDATIRPWLERMGFAVAIHPNPHPGFGPILTAERMEDPARPTILTYRPRRHGARAGRPVAQRPRSMAPHPGGRSLVRPRHRRQQGSACGEPLCAGGGDGGARRRAGFQPGHGRRAREGSQCRFAALASLLRSGDLILK
jgi:hypothetical protein